MSDRFVAADRETPMLMAPSLQDWLRADHLARFVVEAVERLDLRTVENSYAGRGELAYRPKILLALLIYGYATGTFSSRKIERACLDSIAFRYIAANTSPDHDTIANFRKRILPMLPSLFLQVLLIARELGFLTLGQISLDGSKIKANASKHHAYSYRHAAKLKAKLRREIARLLKLAEKADNEPLPDLDIPAEIARRESMIARIDEARAKIEAREAERHAAVQAQHAERLARRREHRRLTGTNPVGRPPEAPKLRVEPTAQINLTDEESRIMPTADGFVQGYNAQAAVTMDSRFVVYGAVTQATNDKEQLVPALEELRSLPPLLGAIEALVADAGYYSAANVQACEEAAITPYVAIRREEHHSWLARKLDVPKGQPSLDASAVERMAHRLKTDDGREVYARRKSTVEPVIGVVKSPMGFRSFMLRGHRNVDAEWKLVCTAYNLKHLHALLAGKTWVVSA
jgi:transposase